MANQNYKQVHIVDEVEEKFFELIKANPVLYSGSKKPQDIEMRESIWRQIAEELQISVSDCKTKLKYIIRERLHRPKKDKSSNSAVAGKACEGLKFVADHCLEQQIVHDDHNVVQAALKEENKELACEIFYQTEPQLEKYPEPSQKSDLSMQQFQLEPLQELQAEFLKFHGGKRLSDTSPKRSKRTKAIATQENMDQHVASRPSSPSALFFQTMAAIVKTFPPALAVEARMKICNLVGEFELRALVEQGARVHSPAKSLTSPEN